MNVRLLYQKVYFKSDEWKEFISFISSLSSIVTISLLSKNTVDASLKEIKKFLLGECLILELFINDNFFSTLFSLTNKIQQKYAARVFLIGFLVSLDNRIYFIKVDQLHHYSTLLIEQEKKKKNTISSIHQLLLYEILKLLKFPEITYSLSLSYLKNNAVFSKNTLNYYY